MNAIPNSLTPTERAALERLRADAYDNRADWAADGPRVLVNIDSQEILDSWACHKAMLRLLPAVSADSGQPESPVNIEELERLLAEATPLLWYVNSSGVQITDANGICIAEVFDRGTETPSPKSNAALIVAAINSLPARKGWIERRRF